MAIVGDVLDNGETGTTIGAVGEGIAITTIGWVEEITLAIMTDSNIWRH